MELPLGLKEDLHLEFKAAAALRDVSNVAREVVAFLNTDGGVVWIGVGEKDGVASSIEAIQDAERERDRLQNAIVDLVEPSPVVGDDVAIEIAPLEAAPDLGVLCVRVKKGQRPPYALRRQSARAFLRRTGSRIREMTREEMADAFARSKPEQPDSVEEAKAAIDARMRECADAGEFSGMKVIVRSVTDVALNLDRNTLEPLLREPSLTGNRRYGWNFCSNHSELRVKQHGWRFGDEGTIQWLTIGHGGDLEFNASSGRLQWRGEPNELWPFALIELPVSVARLASTLYSKFVKTQLDPDTRIIIAIGLFQIGDRTLRPYSPNSVGYMFSEQKSYREISQQAYFFSDPPHDVTFADLQRSPDRCVYPLIRQLYRAFEYEESKIPQEYQPETGLRFPA